MHSCIHALYSTIMWLVPPSCTISLGCNMSGRQNYSDTENYSFLSHKHKILSYIISMCNTSSAGFLHEVRIAKQYVFAQ